MMNNVRWLCHTYEYLYPSNVSLDPSKVCDIDDPGDKHSYSAAWYGGAAAAYAKLSLGPLGLDWPPPIDHQPALNQNWSDATTEREQWILSAGSSIDQVRKFSTQALSVTTQCSPKVGVTSCTST